MATYSGKPASLWLDTAEGSGYPPLDGDMEVDVAVIGAGIVGITAAELLTLRGRKVALIEARRAGGQVTGHTTAKLTSLHGAIYADLVERYGRAAARTYGEANQAALERIARFVRDKGIDCDFERKTAYTYSLRPETVETLEMEAAAAADIGLPASFVRAAPLPYPIAGAVRFDNQAQFHPQRYLQGLLRGLRGTDCRIFEQTRVLDVEEEERCRVITQGGTVRARDVIIATNLPFLARGGFFTKAFPRHHLVVAGRIAEAEAPDGMYLCIDQPSHSFRTWRGADGLYLILAGEGFKTGQVGTGELQQRLERLARERFGVEEIAYRWGNQDFDSMDRLPFIGRLTGSAHHVYTATGFGAWGLTNGTLAAMLLCDAITHVENPWASLFDATRLNLRSSAGKFLRENIDVATEWVGDRVGLPRERAIRDLPPGEGGVYRVRGEKLAVYRDPEGRLHARSAVCTHLRCVVSWNSAESTWDCPCHGSRYLSDGSVLSGPAVNPLEPRLMD